MKPPKCSRLWIPEAVRDGRVSGAEREAFDRHLRTCSDCQHESRMLNELAQALQNVRIAEPHPLAVRRGRQRLMAESDAASLTQSRPIWRGPIAGALMVLVGLVLAFGWWRRAHRDTQYVDRATEETAIEVRSEPGARWERTRSGGASGVELHEGAIWLRIRKHASAGRVLITTPDAEIEDLGTTLRVRVTSAHIQEIAVEEGMVVVRLRASDGEFRLRAGESWMAPERSVDPPETTDTVDPSAASPGVATKPSVGPLAGAATKPSVGPSPRALRNRHTEPQVQSQSEGSTESFVEEDRGYLHVVELARAGRTAEARAQARQYLLRFPNGFRRVEMLDLATGQSR